VVGLVLCAVVIVMLLTSAALRQDNAETDGMLLLSLAFIALFVALLALFRKGPQAQQKMERMYWPLWNWSAKVRARTMLKLARKLAPFEAQYQAGPNQFSYSRSKDGKASTVWTRTLHGCCVDGDGFSLFFKQEHALIPYAIVLHQRAAEWEALLEGQGIRLLVLPS
jgi:hypothetical protein